MDKAFLIFERLVRRSGNHSLTQTVSKIDVLHPFDERNVHPEIAKVTRKLFDDGHYSQATFESFKYLDRRVARVSSSRQSGFKLMMNAFNEKNPMFQLTRLSNESEIDEQRGYSFLFAGSMVAIRNPRGHIVGNIETIDQCLDHLCLASLLLRRLESRIAPKSK